MNRLYPTDLPAFLRKYRFTGGRLRRVRILHGASGKCAVEFKLLVKTALRDLGVEPKPVRLTFRLVDVDEFRFQKRPNGASGKLADVRFGYFQNLYFVNLDAWGLEPGETPKIHDFRNSDAFIAGRDLFWKEDA